MQGHISVRRYIYNEAIQTPNMLRLRHAFQEYRTAQPKRPSLKQLQSNLPIKICLRPVI
jgi:hypothetical protein